MSGMITRWMGLSCGGIFAERARACIACRAILGPAASAMAAHRAAASMARPADFFSKWSADDGFTDDEDDDDVLCSCGKVWLSAFLGCSPGCMRFSCYPLQTCAFQARCEASGAQWLLSLHCSMLSCMVLRCMPGRVDLQVVQALLKSKVAACDGC